MAKIEKLSDGELLAAVASNEAQKCFAHLVTRHAPMVLDVCRRRLGNGHDAEDAAQAVFLVLWQKAFSLRSRASVAGWLHHVACNVCRNAKKAQSIRTAREREAAEMIETRSQHQNEWNRIKDLIDDELDGLTEKYRLPIVLFHLEGRSLEETAALLRTKISTVTTRLSRGREKLRTRLARRGVVVPAAAFAGLLAHSVATAAMPLFFAERTAKLACLYAGGRLAAGGLVTGQTAALAKGAMQMFAVRKLRLVIGLLIAAVLGGVGSLVVFQPDSRSGQLLAGESAAQSKAASNGPRNPLEGGAPVKGLRLTLSADTTKTTMLPDGSNALPVKFTVTFTNVGKKPLKLDTWDLPEDGDKLKITVAGPAGGVAIKDIRPLIRRRRPPRKLADFPTLAKSGMYQVAFSSHGIGRYFQIRLRKPGTYRFKVVYHSREQQYPEKFAQGYWIGSVTSKEFVLTVRPPAKVSKIREPVREITRVKMNFKRPLPGRLPVEGTLRIANAKEARDWFTAGTVADLNKVLDFAADNVIVVCYSKGLGRFLKYNVDKDNADLIVHFFTTKPKEKRADVTATRFFIVPRNAKVRFSDRPPASKGTPKPSVKLIDDPNELARMKRYYPNGFNFVNAIRYDGKIIWHSKVIQGNKVLGKTWELTSINDFKKILSKEKLNKQAAFEVHLPAVNRSLELAAARAQSILDYLRQKGYKKAGVVSN